MYSFLCLGPAPDWAWARADRQLQLRLGLRLCNLVFGIWYAGAGAQAQRLGECIRAASLRIAERAKQTKPVLLHCWQNI